MLREDSAAMTNWLLSFLRRMTGISYGKLSVCKRLILGVRDRHKFLSTMCFVIVLVKVLGH